VSLVRLQGLEPWTP